MRCTYLISKKSCTITSGLRIRIDVYCIDIDRQTTPFYNYTRGYKTASAQSNYIIHVRPSISHRAQNCAISLNRTERTSIFCKYFSTAICSFTYMCRLYAMHIIFRINQISNIVYKYKESRATKRTCTTKCITNTFNFHILCKRTLHGRA